MSATVRGHSPLAATLSGRTRQITAGYNGLADRLKRARAAQAQAGCPDDLAALTRDQLQALVVSLQAKLEGALATIEDLRALANRDAALPADAMWDTATVARKSGVNVSTICRNAQRLGGIKLGGDWMFPSGTTYGRRRAAK